MRGLERFGIGTWRLGRRHAGKAPGLPETRRQITLLSLDRQVGLSLDIGVRRRYDRFTMKNIYVVVNSSGLVFCGISAISGNAIWLNMGDDITEHASDCDALRFKRDARWLAKASKYDASATWKAI